MPKFVVIENSGLGPDLCNGAVVVEATGPVEAAKLGSKCPIDMLISDEFIPGVWVVKDEISEVGWSGTGMDVKHPSLIGPNGPKFQWVVMVVGL